MSFYSTPFSITSQFAFCGLPLRLDTYRGCGFNCSYCFARNRGGSRPEEVISSANHESIERVFRRALDDGAPGVIAEFLRRRVPIHLGGMSDPLQPAERRYRTTEAVLRVLQSRQYPTVMSTKSAMVIEPPYLGLLSKLKPLVVQFSFSTLYDTRARLIEPHATPPSILLKAMSVLSDAGVIVTCRWQPFVPGFSEPVNEFVERIQKTGCRHIAFEHLKVPYESVHDGWGQFLALSERDFISEYRLLGAKRDGRELVLTAENKLERTLEVRDIAHRAGMTFGAADNEFQYLSDTACCCSGVDQFDGFENFFRHQIGFAVRQGLLSGAIEYESIAAEWAPSGSIDRYLNSRSRIGARTNKRGTVQDHIHEKWNLRGSPGSPETFYGVSEISTGAKGSPNRRFAIADTVVSTNCPKGGSCF